MTEPIPQQRLARHEWTPVPALGVSVHGRAWEGSTESTPLVLVAGLGVSSRYWVRLGNRLTSERWVLAPDLPGFGRTPPVPGSPWPAGPDVREQADQLLAWMDARGISRAVLCGHSVGCQTVVDLAVRFPHRVERIILAAPPFEPGRRSLAVSLPRLALAALFEVVSLPLLLCVEYGSTGPARAIQQALRSMHYPMERQLPLVQAPALVVHGQFDPLVSRRWVERVADLLPHAALVEVADVGHAMHYSAAAVTAEVVDRFFRDDLRGPVVTPRSDPTTDPAGPWQPIAVGLSRLLGVLLAMALRRTSRPTAVTLAAVAVCRLPPVTRSSLTASIGVALVLKGVRRRRLATLLCGLCSIALATLAAKPTGPARRIG